MTIQWEIMSKKPCICQKPGWGVESTPRSPHRFQTLVGIGLRTFIMINYSWHLHIQQSIYPKSYNLNRNILRTYPSLNQDIRAIQIYPELQIQSNPILFWLAALRKMTNQNSIIFEWGNHNSIRFATPDIYRQLRDLNLGPNLSKSKQLIRASP